MTIFKCIHNLAPNYLSDHVTFVNDIQVRDTRQSDQNLLYVPFARTASLQKSFSCYGPKCWNTLPNELRFIDNLMDFKNMCKQYFIQS